MDKPHNISSARIKAGLKQRELADMLGVSQMAVSKWERGNFKDIGYNMTLNIAKATNIPHDAIDFTSQGNKKEG